MSDNIPFEIQAEIIKRIPDVKSLIQFRSVSKPWKSLIDSSKFVSDYNAHHIQPQHYVLIRYIDPKDSDQKYVSILDDDSFPENMFPLTVPISVRQLLNKPYNSSSQDFAETVNKPIIVGSSKGLFCLYDFYGKSSYTGTKTVVLWNPSIRKSVDIVVPNVLDSPYETVVGFGVCPQSSDPKLVKVTQISCPLKYAAISCIPWQVEVFTLSSGIWRSPCGNLPSKSVALKISSVEGQVDIDGAIYWLANDRIVVDTVFHWCPLIMSFNLTSETFTEIDLPDSLALDPDVGLFISKLRESLVVLDYNVETMKRVYGVWMMNHGVEKSFTKLFTIKTRQLERVLEFRKSGEPIVGKRIDSKDCSEDDALYVTETNSKHLKYLGISGKRFSFFASSYVETLLLLDH